MFVARQLSLLGIFLMAALAGPQSVAAELPAVGAPVAAAAESVAVEAPPAVPADSAGEAASLPAEATPPPPPPAEAATPPPSAEAAAPPPSPSAQPVETVEHAAAAVESAVRSSLPPEPQQLTEVTREAQEELGEVADRADEKGEAVLRAAADVAKKTGEDPLDAIRPVRDVVSPVLGPAKDLLPPAPIEPTLSKPVPSIPANPPGPSPIAAGETGAEMPTRPFLAPETTLISIPAPASIRGVPAPVERESDSGRFSPIDLSGEGGGLHRIVGSIAPAPRSGDPGSAGSRSPEIPSLPDSSLPEAIDAVATAPGGAGAGSLLALLALSLLFVPTFVSKLRMHAGDCRPAPFVSLLERPG